MQIRGQSFLMMRRMMRRTCTMVYKKLHNQKQCVYKCPVRMFVTSQSLAMKQALTLGHNTPKKGLGCKWPHSHHRTKVMTLIKNYGVF